MDFYSGEPVWGYAESDDSERWSGGFKTQAEAEDACRDDFGHGYVCEARWISPGKVAAWASDMNFLLERMDELEEVPGAFDEPIFDIDGQEATDTARAELGELTAAWAEKHIKSRHWICTGEPIRVEPSPSVDEASR